MKNLLDELEQEHIWIEKEIAEFQNAPLDKTQFLKFLNFVETHHQKEEKQLFPWIAEQTWLTQGGPKCTYFMGLRLDFNHSAAVQTALKRFVLSYPDFKFNDPEYFTWLQSSSPLSIPMEEHQLSSRLKECLLYILDCDPQQMTEDQSLGKKLLDNYVDLLKIHLVKERDCLFVLCRQKTQL